MFNSKENFEKIQVMEALACPEILNGGGRKLK